MDRRENGRRDSGLDGRGRLDDKRATARVRLTEDGTRRGLDGTGRLE